MAEKKIKLTPLLDTLYLGKLEDAVYFSPKYSDYISNSRLGLLKQKGPEAFIEGFKQGFNPSFQLGSMVHELVLQKDLFELAPDLGKPTAKLGAVADYLFKSFCENPLVSDELIYEASDAIDYFKGKMNTEKCNYVRGNCIDYWRARKKFEESYITKKTVEYADTKLIETVKGCVTSLESNPNIINLLYPKDIYGRDIITENEQAILVDVKVDIEGEKPYIVHLKAKIDNYTVDTTSNIITINDVKTTIKDTRIFNEVVEMYSYYRELSFYAMLLNLCSEKYYGIKNPIIKGNFLVVSTIDPYHTRVFQMNKDLFKMGIEEYKVLLKDASYYIKYGYDN